MKEILYDSRLELDRLPLGAVADGSGVRFGLRAKDGLGFEKLYIKVINDAGGEVYSQELLPVWWDNGYARYETVITTGEPGLYWYWFSALTPGGELRIGRFGSEAVWDRNDSASWQLMVYSKEYITPDWIKGGVFYHIFVDRFRKSGELPLREGAVKRDDWGGVPVYAPDANGKIRNNDFFGGNLDGIREKLPYLHELGVTCIYLSPVFEAASNHKYDTSDYMKIDSSFGDEATFSALCSEAGDYGIKLICDGVFNHTGDDSLYFDRYGHYGGNGAFNTQASPYYSWYSFSNWPNEYEAWWGIDTLPQVREDNPEYRSFIFGADGVLRHWMRAGISGWRLDVADELPEAFLRELRATVKGENPEALIIGEVWEDATTKIAYGERRHYFDGRELDAVMNYPFKSGVIDYMRSGNAEQFREVVDSICENYPKPALDCLMNGLGTHDTARILTVLGGEDFPDKDQRANASMSRAVRETAKERLYTASLLQFTLPGVPCIYYGDEAGMEGYEDPLNRRCFPWGGEDKQIQGWYTALSKLRRDTPAFAGGSYRTLTAKNGVFSFMRRKGDSGVAITVNLGGERENIGCMGSVKILLSHRMSILGDQLFLEPGGSAVMVMK